jgi:hypothetical protein
MPYPDMPTQNLPLPAAFEANDIVARNRSPDLHRWIARLRFRRFPQRQQGLIDNVDERRHVGGGKLAFPDVTSDDLGDQRLVNRPPGRLH